MRQFAEGPKILKKFSSQNLRICDLRNLFMDCPPLLMVHMWIHLTDVHTSHIHIYMQHWRRGTPGYQRNFITDSVAVKAHNGALEAPDPEQIRNTMQRWLCAHIWHCLISPLIIPYKKGDGLGGYYFVTSHHWKASNFVTPPKKGFIQGKNIFLKYISSIQEFRWIFHGNSYPVTGLLVGVF